MRKEAGMRVKLEVRTGFSNFFCVECGEELGEVGSRLVHGTEVDSGTFKTRMVPNRCPNSGMQVENPLVFDLKPLPGAAT